MKPELKVSGLWKIKRIRFAGPEATSTNFRLSALTLKSLPAGWDFASERVRRKKSEIWRSSRSPFFLVLLWLINRTEIISGNPGDNAPVGMETCWDSLWWTVEIKFETVLIVREVCLRKKNYCYCLEKHCTILINKIWQKILENWCKILHWLYVIFT